MTCGHHKACSLLGESFVQLDGTFEFYSRLLWVAGVVVVCLITLQSPMDHFVCLTFLRGEALLSGHGRDPPVWSVQSWLITMLPGTRYLHQPIH